ncbi:MAG: universal stress protein [Deltaproteobacteria bacterium]|nr:universal stress protein [Deltaproteobacteria bacterium]
MFHKILVVFENEEVCTSAVTFARELALRMDSEVTFLMLVEMPFLGNSFLGSKRNAITDLEKRAAEKLSGFSSQFLETGIEVSVALRVGEPPQELLKFLAGRPAFQAIVWGSGEVLPDKGHLRRDHWVSKVANTLECPLLTVSSKASEG